jgi:hypothetical protein
MNLLEQSPRMKRPSVARWQSRQWQLNIVRRFGELAANRAARAAAGKRELYKSFTVQSVTEPCYFKRYL